ncbi:Outer membrane protein beta-barrel domain-containing protein [Lutibacter agarilyticus]|uniref:Outer membrane protein beta-barrel domain-containing protein n=1 Tax=Lutibacter agarilyticus TaxID=1109740 RepID=A0A238VF37_9FLAO|nr:porin family protein [Lutibacter agarilyticus]SNR32283.1 Outer membrane protein beta-barrel domain-containing protein [Lutibacter agarilyticus]
MKNLNKILVVFFLLANVFSYAQTNKYGIRAGVGIPNLKSTDNNIYSKDYKSVTGFDGSLFADFGITEQFSIKAELGFLRKGGERNGWQPIPPTTLPPELVAFLPAGKPVYAEFDNKAVFSYLEIPILAKYEWDLGETWGVYVNGGPYIDFMLSPKQVTSGTSSLYYDEGKQAPVQVRANPQDPPADWFLVDLPPVDLTAETDISKDLGTIDFGAMFGVGVTAAISKHSELLLDIRGSYGLIPLQNDKDIYGTVHMGNLSFAVGYAYTFESKVQKPIKD